MNKKVYFAGSIRGGREDEQLYKDIIAYIKKTDTVLTEHVGDLSLNAMEATADRDKAIYLQDTGWLKECDLVIAECTTASLGVGYELAFAEKYNKPCYVFYRPAKANLSAMIKGDDYYHIYQYDNIEQFKSYIDSIFNSLD